MYDFVNSQLHSLNIQHNTIPCEILSCMYIYIYTCIYVCMYECIYVYIYVNILSIVLYGSVLTWHNILQVQHV